MGQGRPLPIVDTAMRWVLENRPKDTDTCVLWGDPTPSNTMWRPDGSVAALIDWESAPYARVCHAREDHFVPLFAALGAAEGEKATRVYHDTDLFGGVTASSYRIG